MVQIKKSRIILAIKAIHSLKKISIRRASEIYVIPYSTLRNRMTGRTLRRDTRANSYNLDIIKKEVLIKYILNLNKRGFAFSFFNVKNMADLLLKSRNVNLIGKH